MKSAAKRDMSCESQNSAYHAILERIRRSRVFPGACPSERRSQKSSNSNFERRSSDGRSGVCRNAVSWERGAPLTAPRPRRGIGCQSFRRERLTVQLTSGVYAPIHSKLNSNEDQLESDRRRP